MKENLIQRIKKQGISHISNILNQGKSSDKILQKQNVEAEPKEVLHDKNNYIKGDTFFVEITQKFPNNIAKLEINLYSENEKTINIRFYHSSFEPGGKQIIIPQTFEVSFNTDMRDTITNDLNKKSLEFIGKMRKFSEKNGKAHSLVLLLSKLQKQLSYLIINDRTNLEIPWEMLKLESDDYLGAAIVTARWQDIINKNDSNNDELINFEVQENNCCGEIVAYLNTKELKNVKKEEDVIIKYKNKLHKNINDFLTDLDSRQEQVSLIFIASHGFYGKDDKETSFGQDDNDEQKISLMQLRSYDLKFLTKFSTIVFMNACHSGRLYPDPDNITNPNYETGKSYLSGFPIFFLEKGAKGVVGTLYSIDDEYAFQVSNYFFQEYQDNPSLSVATILRNIRKKVVQKYIDNKHETAPLFLHTFMYIYYGNPMTTLQIIPHEEN